MTRETEPGLPHAAPAEADGWRVVQDPDIDGKYWRMRAFELEFNYWGHITGVWLYPWATPPDSPGVARLRREHPKLIANLFCEP